MKILCVTPHSFCKDTSLALPNILYVSYVPKCVRPRSSCVSTLAVKEMFGSKPSKMNLYTVTIFVSYIPWIQGKIQIRKEHP